MAAEAAIGHALERLVEAGELAVILLDENLLVTGARGALANAAPVGTAIDECLPYLAGLAPDLLNLQDEPEAAFLLSNVGLAGPESGEKVNIEAFWQADDRRYCLLIHKLGLRTAPEAEIAKQIKSRRIAEQHLQQTRQALALQQTLVESIADSAPVALAILDGHLTYLYATRAWHDLFGLGPDPLAGQTIADTPGPREAFCLETLAKANAGQSFLDIEVAITGRDSARNLHCNIVPWRSAHGSVDRLLLTANELSGVLSERLSLRNEVVRLADANRSLEDVLAVIAHDLEAPRRAIERALQSPGDRTLDEIAIHSVRMGTMLRDLVEHARLAGAPAEPEPVDVRAVAEAARATAEGGSHFALRCEPPTMVVAAGRVLLETIVRNLVANAVRHHDIGRGTIDLVLDDRGSEWRLGIADDGPGIAEAERAQIFEPFRQLEGGRGRGGAGLGLSLVRFAAQRMGGTISARDRGDGQRGALFELAWPKARQS